MTRSCLQISPILSNFDEDGLKLDETLKLAYWDTPVVLVEGCLIDARFSGGHSAISYKNPSSTMLSGSYCFGEANASPLSK